MTAIALLFAALLPQEEGEIRKAVEQALPLLEKGVAGAMKERSCFTCHNHGLPVLAFTAARDRGFKVDEEGLKAVLRHTEEFLRRNLENYRQGKGQGGQVDTAGYALWTLEEGGWKPDETTAAVAHYLVVRDRERGHWTHVSTRPPSEASAFTTTYLAIYGLRAYGTEGEKEAARERVEKARAWLLEARPKDTEDRVFRLRALREAKAGTEAVAAAAKDLLGTQREDGGWAQLPDGASDAYATATALAALADAGGVTAPDPAFRKGIAWLLSGRKEDGSWHVATRSKPIQKYFESGFPHGKDQFISIAATSWAVVALARALPAPR